MSEFMEVNLDINCKADKWARGAPEHVAFRLYRLQRPTFVMEP